MRNFLLGGLATLTLSLVGSLGTAQDCVTMNSNQSPAELTATLVNIAYAIQVDPLPDGHMISGFTISSGMPGTVQGSFVNVEAYIFLKDNATGKPQWPPLVTTNIKVLAPTGWYATDPFPNGSVDMPPSTKFYLGFKVPPTYPSNWFSLPLTWGNLGFPSNFYEYSFATNSWSPQLGDTAWMWTIKCVPPVTNFQADVTSGPAPLTVKFTDTSLNYPITFNWDFTNNGQWDSTSKNPTHKYNLPGLYSVKHVSACVNIANTITKTNYINVLPPLPPVADFHADKLEGYAPMDVQFTDDSTAPINAWSWEFKNNGHVGSSNQDPLHTYNTPGLYSVKLTVTNDSGTASVVKTDYVNVKQAIPPTGEFYALPTSGCAPLTVQFFDNSSGDPPSTSWTWDFKGDGSVDSTQQNPTKEFTGAGLKTIIHASKNKGGTGTVTKVAYIEVLEPISQAGVFGAAQNFTTGPTPYSADFGDLNGDGAADLIIADSTATSASVMLGNGAGGLGSASTYSMATASHDVRTVVLMDLNSDSNLDMVAGVAGVGVRLGNGIGGFGALASYSNGQLGSYASYEPTSMAGGDLNLDGIPDLLLAGTLLPPQIMLGNGIGGFGPLYSLAPYSLIYSAALGDSNNDGYLDAVLARPWPPSSTGELALALGDGSGSFGSLIHSPQSLPANPFFIALGEFNKDGYLDVAVTHSDFSSVSLGSATGTFGQPITAVPAGSAALAVAMEDLNLDGASDVATVRNVQNGRVVVALGNGSCFGSITSYTVAEYPNFMGTVDLNSDGKPDLVALSSSMQRASVLLNELSIPQGIGSLGSGTPGCLGTLGVTANKPPKVNTPDFKLLCSNTPKNALGLTLLGDAQDLVGTDLFSIGLILHIDIFESTFLNTFDTFSDFGGQGVTPLPIPNTPAFIGNTYILQTIFIETSGFKCTNSPYGFVGTKGLTLTVLP